MALSVLETIQILLVAYVPILFARHGLPLAVIDFYVLHSWELILATFALPILALIYTTPNSPLRLAVVPCVALGAVIYHIASPLIIPNRAIAAAFDGPFMLLFLTSVDALLLRRLFLTPDGKERSWRKDIRKSLDDKSARLESHSNAKVASLWDAIAWAFHVIFSYRAIGSTREAKHVPRFSHSDPTYVPSRSELLLKRGVATASAFLFVDFISHQPPPSTELFIARKASLLPAMSDLTAETVMVRIFSTALFWFTLRITIGLIYNAVSFIGLASLLTSPADWPPYFGSVKDAYTLRKFWAVFWHSGLRNSLLGTAKFFTYDVLRLPRGSVLARYANIFLTFAISGVIHKLVDDTSGIPALENTVYTLFFMQAVGITIEDGIEFVYRTGKLGRGLGTRKEQRGGTTEVMSTKGWQRAVGYLWVGAWLVWTTPAWSYANIRHDGDQLFRFSVVETVRVWRA